MEFSAGVATFSRLVLRQPLVQFLVMAIAPRYVIEGIVLLPKLHENFPRMPGLP
jgi:hypothetical protein